MVTLEAIGKQYGTAAPVLRDVSLSLVPGGFHVLTGARGAGKTTLLRILTLAEAPSCGRVELFGTDAASASRDMRAALRRRIGIVFQDLRLVPHLSVRDNIALPLRIAGAPATEIETDIDALLDWVGLADRGAETPATLWGDAPLRVAIARAVVGRPDLLVADEPDAGSDRAAAEILLRFFERMNEIGTTVLIAASDPDVACLVPHTRLDLEAGSLSLAPAA